MPLPATAGLTVLAYDVAFSDSPMSVAGVCQISVVCHVAALLGAIVVPKHLIAAVSTALLSVHDGVRGYAKQLPQTTHSLPEPTQLAWFPTTRSLNLRRYPLELRIFWIGRYPIEQRTQAPSRGVQEDNVFFTLPLAAGRLPNNARFATPKASAKPEAATTIFGFSTELHKKPSNSLSY